MAADSWWFGIVVVSFTASTKLHQAWLVLG